MFIPVCRSVGSLMLLNLHIDSFVISRHCGSKEKRKDNYFSVSHEKALKTSSNWQKTRWTRVHPPLPEGCKFNLHFLIRRATLCVIQFVAKDVCYQTSGHPFSRYFITYDVARLRNKLPGWLDVGCGWELTVCLGEEIIHMSSAMSSRSYWRKILVIFLLIAGTFLVLLKIQILLIRFGILFLFHLFC